MVTAGRVDAMATAAVTADGRARILADGNEASVGRALRDSGVPRDEVFITTKFYPNRKDPEAEVQRSLERLGVDQVDPVSYTHLTLPTICSV